MIPNQYKTTQQFNSITKELIIKKNNEIYFTYDKNIKYQINKHLNGYGYAINTERDSDI